MDDLRKGSEEAFTVFFTNYFNRICQFAITYVKEEAVAKNIVQDAFAKLWENRHGITENSSIFSCRALPAGICIRSGEYAGIRRIRQKLNYLKHQQVENNFKRKLEDRHKQLVFNYNALQKLDVESVNYNELLQILETAVASLPPQCQRAFRLSRYENLTNIEIANKLQISLKAVEANITRALKILRIKLKDYLLLLLLFNLL